MFSIVSLVLSDFTHKPLRYFGCSGLRNAELSRSRDVAHGTQRELQCKYVVVSRGEMNSQWLEGNKKKVFMLFIRLSAENVVGE